MNSNILIKTGRLFFVLALFVYGIEQFYFGTFRKVFFSPWQEHLPVLWLFAYLYGAYFLFTGTMILMNRNGRKWAALLGTVLLLTFIFIHIPFKYFGDHEHFYEIGQWVNELKCFALSGCAFVVAYSFRGDTIHDKNFKWMESLIPHGNLFFLFVMACFGICHILYVEGLQNLVPQWFPPRKFWVIFTGIALISSGVGIALGIKIRIIAILQSIMIFCWVWMVHLRGVMGDPMGRRAEYTSSLFDALAFSGIALLIALTMKEQKWISDLRKRNRGNAA